MVKYANGKYAFGFCDRTGFRYDLKDLRREFVGGNPTGFLVGISTWVICWGDDKAVSVLKKT